MSQISGQNINNAITDNVRLQEPTETSHKTMDKNTSHVISSILTLYRLCIVDWLLPIFNNFM